MVSLASPAGEKRFGAPFSSGRKPGFEALVASIKRSLSRRFALRLTVEGYCLVLAMMLIGLAALNTAAPLLYLMFALLSSFFVLSALLATNTIRGVDVRRRIPHTWMAGKPLLVQVRFQNTKLFSSSFSLRLSDKLRDGQTVGVAFADRVPPREMSHHESYETCFARRGVYRFHALQLGTRFPFGLIERRVSFPARDRVLVLPQTIPVERVMEDARSELGDFESNQKGTGSGLYGFREYTAESSAKDIHWKVSARRGQLMVREYESEERRRASVVLDNRVPDGEPDPLTRERFEHAVIVAGSVIQWLVNRGHEVELRTASGIVGFGFGAAHITRCHRALAGLDFVTMRRAPRFAPTGPDPTVMTMPIILHGRGVAGRGVFPIHVDDFRSEIARAIALPSSFEAKPAEGKGGS